jgi:hypothetical protein
MFHVSLAIASLSTKLQPRINQLKRHKAAETRVRAIADLTLVLRVACADDACIHCPIRGGVMARC